MDLFTDPAPVATVEDGGRRIVVPDTLDRRVEVFLHRWGWRSDRDTVRKELMDLIDFAKRQA